jgi:hypothetical protein
MIRMHCEGIIYVCPQKNFVCEIFDLWKTIEFNKIDQDKRNAIKFTLNSSQVVDIY